MGEIADMMLDGTMCQMCGCYMNDGEDGDGFPVTCDSCLKDIPATEHYSKPAVDLALKVKMPCPICKKMIVPSGLHQHLKAKHPDG